MKRNEYIDQLVKLELNASKIYRLFSELNELDKDFWWKLSMEEVNHASLLKSIHYYINLDSFPDEMIIKNIQEVLNINKYLEDIILQYKINPSRKKAFDIAIEIENSAAESHFEKVMTEQSNNNVIEVFKKLNKDDVNHLNRIIKYMKENNI